MAELVLRRLLPLAAEGLDRWGVDAADADRLLGIIEQRCLTGRNGAAWQAETFHRLDGGQRLDRHDALRRMTQRLHRAHAQQRARARLARRLTRRGRRGAHADSLSREPPSAPGTGHDCY